MGETKKNRKGKRRRSYDSYPTTEEEKRFPTMTPPTSRKVLFRKIEEKVPCT